MWWIAALPVVLLAGSAVFWSFGSFQAGIVPGRGAMFVLVVGAALAALVLRVPAHRRAWLASPAFWALLALVWQVLLLLVVAPVREPGLAWMVERAAALATAAAAAAWFVRDPPRAVWAIAACAAGVLILGAVGETVVGGTPIGVLAQVGAGPPFGLANFNVGGALPLLGATLLLWWRERQGRPRWPWHVWLLLGWVAAVLLGFGVRWVDVRLTIGDPARGALVGIAAMVLAALALALPRRWHLPAALLLAGGFLVAQVLAMLGELPIGQAPSTLQRIFMWRAAVDAIAAAPVAGYGPGASIVALMQHEWWDAAWLAVPSYAEHAHHEGLQVLLDGGVVNVVLLAMALALTIGPLWRRRAEAVPAALLVAWAGVAATAAIDVHLSQPGPLLLLALLAGASWACVREPGSVPAPTADIGPWAVVAVLACVLASLGAAAYIAGEARGNVGTPTELDQRRMLRLKQLEGRRDFAGCIEVVQRDQRRVGPLADLPLREALYERRSGTSRRARVEEIAEAQARTLPIHPDQIAMLQRLRVETPAGSAPSPTVERLLAEAVRRARRALELVPVSETNRVAREKLEKVLAVEDAQAK